MVGSSFNWSPSAETRICPRVPLSGTLLSIVQTYFHFLISFIIFGSLLTVIYGNRHWHWHWHWRHWHWHRHRPWHSIVGLCLIFLSPNPSISHKKTPCQWMAAHRDLDSHGLCLRPFPSRNPIISHKKPR